MDCFESADHVNAEDFSNFPTRSLRELLG